MLFPTPKKSSQPKAFLIKPFILGDENHQGSFLGKGQLGMVTILGYNPKCPNINVGAMYLVVSFNTLIFQCSLVHQGLGSQACHLVALLSSQTIIFLFPPTPKKSHDPRLELCSNHVHFGKNIHINVCEINIKHLTSSNK